MSLPRIYQPIPLSPNLEITLNAWGIQHLKALRLRTNDPLIIFNGDGYDYTGEIIRITTKEIHVQLTSQQTPPTESKLTLNLLQAVSRGERMDYTIQKSTELGITSITPIISERCEIKLSKDRWEKRQQHWQQIAISACEQTGRTKIPRIHFPKILSNALESKAELAIILDPFAEQTLIDLEPCFKEKPPEISILIGSEGGFTATEIDFAQQNGFQPLRLGPRILRTETAAPALLAALHAKWGDFT
jgi:16S rRNA (uracil1498-N3)-methyltransferase